MSEEINCEFVAIGKFRGAIYEERGAPIIWEIYDTSKRVVLGLGFSCNRQGAKRTIAKEVVKHINPKQCE